MPRVSVIFPTRRVNTLCVLTAIERYIFYLRFKYNDFDRRSCSSLLLLLPKHLTAVAGQAEQGLRGGRKLHKVLWLIPEIGAGISTPMVEG